MPDLGSGIVQNVGRILQRLLNILLLLALPLALCFAILGAQLLSPKRLNFVDLSPKTWGGGDWAKRSAGYHLVSATSPGGILVQIH